jgi:hypothetical protein
VADVGPYFFLAAFFLVVFFLAVFFFLAFFFAGILFDPPFPCVPFRWPSGDLGAVSAREKSVLRLGGGRGARTLSTPGPPRGFYFFLAAFFLVVFFLAVFLRAFFLAGIEEIPPFSPKLGQRGPPSTSRVSKGFAY